MGDYRETLYTIDAKGNRRWVYLADSAGFYRRARAITAIVLLLIYLLMPWITVGGSQAIFLDIGARRFVFFGTVLWATDSRFLFLALSSLALCMFFFTAILGRVWCGWACPETVFLEFVYRPIERLLEGTPGQRRSLDAEPWNFRKLRIKLTKYALYAFISWFIASTALAYFLGREPLLAMMADYPWHNWSMFVLTLALMGLLLFQFGWFREQMCTVVCPYARFQSALLDDQSLLVGYDAKRGEPRGKPGTPGVGDCIKCSRCVQVCPTGIDIRNGLQLECIQCAACADACDEVMTNIGKPRGLIRYDTECGLAGGAVRLMRPRVMVYAVVLCVLVGSLIYLLSVRDLSEAVIFHSGRDALFTRLETGEVSNHLELSLSNKSDLVRSFSVTVLEPSVKATLPISPFPVQPGAHEKVPLFVTFPPEILHAGKRAVTVEVTDDGGFKKSLEIELLG